MEPYRKRKWETEGQHDEKKDALNEHDGEIRRKKEGQTHAEHPFCCDSVGSDVLCGRVLTLCLLVRTNRRAAIRQLVQTGSTFWLLESRCDRYKFGEVVVATALKVVVEPGRRLEKQRYTQQELEANGWSKQASWDRQEED